MCWRQAINLLDDDQGTFPIIDQSPRIRPVIVADGMVVLGNKMDALAIFNSFEAVFWGGIAWIVFRKSYRSIHRKRLGMIAAGWFLLFGMSDVWEVYSGAWWRPWPLFALKATCITALITCGVAYRSNVRRIAS